MAALSRNKAKARVERQSNVTVFGQARGSGAAQLEGAASLPHSLHSSRFFHPPITPWSCSRADGLLALHWVPSNRGMVCEVFPPTLAAHHWPRTSRTTLRTAVHPHSCSITARLRLCHHSARLTSAVQRPVHRVSH